MNFNKFFKITALTTAVVIPWAMCSLKTREGEIWSWGAGKNGELGLGVEANNSLPGLIKDIKFIDLSAGKSISAGITADGKLYTWGKNRNALLGHLPPNLNVLLPREVEISKIRQVSCGSQHICAVTENGQAYVWGVKQTKSRFRQIGTSQTARTSEIDSKPFKVPLQNIKQVSCRGDLTTLVDSKGSVFLMGASQVKGKNGIQAKLSTDIIELDFDDKILRIQSGLNFSIALNQDGRIYAWGNNTFGQLGIGGLNNLSNPQLVEALYRQKIVDISCGDNFAGVVNDKGEVFTWGFGNQGQLGHGDKSDQFLPRRINTEQKIRKISCGGAHTALLTESGKLLMMGRGRQGQLGREQKDEGNSGYSLKMKPVEQLPLKKISKVSCGSNHTLVLLEAM